MPKIFTGSVLLRKNWSDPIYKFHAGNKVPSWAEGKIGDHLWKDAEDVEEVETIDDATDDESDATDDDTVAEEESDAEEEFGANVTAAGSGDVSAEEDDASTVYDEEDDDGSVPPYSAWSKGELQDELLGRGLKTTGNKGELVERLEENDLED